jgi:hypothetical protein
MGREIADWIEGHCVASLAFQVVVPELEKCSPMNIAREENVGYKHNQKE